MSEREEFVRLAELGSRHASTSRHRTVDAPTVNAVATALLRSGLVPEGLKDQKYYTFLEDICGRSLSSRTRANRTKLGR